MVQGNYANIDSSGIAQLKTWLKQGGTLIATRSANKWLNKVKLAEINLKEIPKINQDTITIRRNYDDAYDFWGAQAIGGSIFSAKLDVTHPLGYGFKRQQIPVFKRGQLFMQPEKNPYNTPLMYGKNSLLAGYISKKNYELLHNTAVITVHNIDKGRIIAFAENPNFRGFWYGTNRLFMNALMFGQILGKLRY
jgi:hypothetical protein